MGEEFTVSFGVLTSFLPYEIAKILTPKGFKVVKGKRIAYEVFDVSLKGESSRAGYIFFGNNDIKLTVQPNDSGSKLKQAWFDLIPIICPSRPVWILLVPGIYERRLMGYVPDNKIGYCESLQELDEKMGDYLYPCGTIAGRLEANLLWRSQEVKLSGYCEIDPGGGLGTPVTVSEGRMVCLTNPSEWGNDR